MIDKDDGPRAYSIDETAERIGVSRTQIYHFFNTGQLGWVKIGARRLVEGDEIRRFLASHRETSNQSEEYKRGWEDGWQARAESEF